MVVNAGKPVQPVSNAVLYATTPGMAIVKLTRFSTDSCVPKSHWKSSLRTGM
jgi:hypothetical protein